MTEKKKNIVSLTFLPTFLSPLKPPHTPTPPHTMPRPKRAAAVAAVKREPELLSSDDAGSPSGSEYAPSPSPAPRRAGAKRAPPAYDSCDDEEFTPPPPRRAAKKEAKKAKKEEPGSDEKKKVKREPKNPINVQLGMPAGWENPDGWPYVLAK